MGWTYRRERPLKGANYFFRVKETTIFGNLFKKNKLLDKFKFIHIYMYNYIIVTSNKNKLYLFL